MRHKVEIHQLTGRGVECPIDEMNRPRGRRDAALRVPPSARQVEGLFAGWRQDLVTCRKFAPAARNYAAARLMTDVGLRVNETRSLDLADVKWELGRFGKLHVRKGKGARGSGARERMVPLINGAGATLRWFVEDVWGQFDDEHTRPGAPLFPSERRNADGSCARVGTEALRASLAVAAARYLPDWAGTVTPHVLRHFCASQLYRSGMDLIAIQQTLGHAWIATTMGYVHEGSGIAADGREAAGRLVISAGKMSGLWSGHPASIKLDDLDVICAVLDCGVHELLTPEPGKVAHPADSNQQEAVSTSAGPTVTPKRRDGRTLPPA